MKISEAARHLGVHPESLRKWEKAGLISCDRTALGHRVFTPERILEIQQIVKERSFERKTK